jgi:hypothetical protein
MFNIEPIKRTTYNVKRKTQIHLDIHPGHPTFALLKKQRYERYSLCT